MAKDWLKTCPVCGRMFVDRKGGRVFCGPLCAEVVRRTPAVAAREDARWRKR